LGKFCYGVEMQVFGGWINSNSGSKIAKKKIN
jgi:hypothetical protein